MSDSTNTTPVVGYVKTIDPKGRITLTQDALQMFNADKGDAVNVIVTPDSITIRKL